MCGLLVLFYTNWYKSKEAYYELTLFVSILPNKVREKQTSNWFALTLLKHGQELPTTRHQQPIRQQQWRSSIEVMIVNRMIAISQAPATEATAGKSDSFHSQEQRPKCTIEVGVEAQLGCSSKRPTIKVVQSDYHQFWARKEFISSRYEVELEKILQRSGLQTQ